jgi:hypothetical protein
MPVIPATWEFKIRRITLGGEARQKVSETSFQPTAGCSSCYSTDSGKCKIIVPGQPGQEVRDPISKITRIKRAGGVAQLVFASA